ncbi:MAG TPA: hypothetical protein VKS22_00235 [Candidatus Binataceae bacterium]|nr:hypothetical protein [Candidatus Binataceae bacterium]
MAKKSSHDTPRLREMGFDPGAPPAEALATLRALRERPDAPLELIAEALGGIASPEAAAALAELEANARGGLRRAIRGALFRLHQRGIEAPVSAPTAAAAPTSIIEEGLTALLSFADADGARIVWMLKPRGGSGGGLRRLWGLASESEGLLGATLESVTRKEYRAQRAELERRAGTPLFEADGALADFILCEAWRQTPEARRGRVGDFLTLRAELLASPPAADFHHPIYRELAAQLAIDPPAELVREPDVGAYKLSAAAIKPYAEEVSGLQQSTIVLSRMQQEERVGTVVERALGDLLAGETAYRLRRHLEDTAYIFARSGKLEAAGWAAAAAARLHDRVDPKRSAFFQAFMRAQLGALLVEQKEEARDEPRLIMTPAEAMRARQAAQARMRGRGAR